MERPNDATFAHNLARAIRGDIDPGLRARTRALNQQRLGARSGLQTQSGATLIPGCARELVRSISSASALHPGYRLMK